MPFLLLMRFMTWVAATSYGISTTAYERHAVALNVTVGILDDTWVFRHALLLLLLSAAVGEMLSSDCIRSSMTYDQPSR
jgi:hypothetical protein